MAEKEAVPAEVINQLTEEIMQQLDKLRKDLMHKNQEKEGEFAHRVVAMYGALRLMLEKHTKYMMKNGYTTEHIEELDKLFLEFFVLVDETPPTTIKDSEDFKN